MRRLTVLGLGGALAYAVVVAAAFAGVRALGLGPYEGAAFALAAAVVAPLGVTLGVVLAARFTDDPATPGAALGAAGGAAAHWLAWSIASGDGSALGAVAVTGLIVVVGASLAAAHAFRAPAIVPSSPSSPT